MQWPGNTMLRYLLEAQFEDGFDYKGTQDDVSVTQPGRNVFFDIREGLQAAHGRITRYSVQGLFPDANGDVRRYDVDFTELPESVKPIWFIEAEKDQYSDGSWGETRHTRYGFGYEFTDDSGQKQKEVIYLT